MSTDHREGDKVTVTIRSQSHPAIVLWATGQNMYVVRIAYRGFGDDWYIAESKPIAGARLLPGRTTTILGLDQCEACGQVLRGDKQDENPHLEKCGECGQYL